MNVVIIFESILKSKTAAQEVVQKLRKDESPHRRCKQPSASVLGGVEETRVSGGSSSYNRPSPVNHPVLYCEAEAQSKEDKSMSSLLCGIGH